MGDFNRGERDTSSRGRIWPNASRSVCADGYEGRRRSPIYCRVGLYGIKATAQAPSQRLAVRRGLRAAAQSLARSAATPSQICEPVPLDKRTRSGTGGTRGANPLAPGPAWNLARHRTCGGTGRSRQNPCGIETVVAENWGRGAVVRFFGARIYLKLRPLAGKQSDTQELSVAHYLRSSDKYCSVKSRVRPKSRLISFPPASCTRASEHVWIASRY